MREKNFHCKKNKKMNGSKREEEQEFPTKGTFSLVRETFPKYKKKSKERQEVDQIECLCEKVA